MMIRKAFIILILLIATGFSACNTASLLGGESMNVGVNGPGADENDSGDDGLDVNSNGDVDIQSFDDLGISPDGSDLQADDLGTEGQNQDDLDPIAMLPTPPKEECDESTESMQAMAIDYMGTGDGSSIPGGPSDGSEGFLHFTRPGAGAGAGMPGAGATMRVGTSFYSAMHAMGEGTGRNPADREETPEYVPEDVVFETQTYECRYDPELDEYVWVAVDDVDAEPPFDAAIGLIGPTGAVRSVHHLPIGSDGRFSAKASAFSGIPSGGRAVVAFKDPDTGKYEDTGAVIVSHQGPDIDISVPVSLSAALK